MYNVYTPRTNTTTFEINTDFYLFGKMVSYLSLSDFFLTAKHSEFVGSFGKVAHVKTILRAIACNVINVML